MFAVIKNFACSPPNFFIKDYKGLTEENIKEIYQQIKNICNVKTSNVDENYNNFEVFTMIEVISYLKELMLNIHK